VNRSAETYTSGFKSGIGIEIGIGIGTGIGIGIGIGIELGPLPVCIPQGRRPL